MKEHFLNKIIFVKFLSLFFYSFSSQGGVCIEKDWIYKDPSVPKCVSDGGILPALSPVRSVFISQLDGYFKDPVTGTVKFGSKPLFDFVAKTLEASGNLVPDIFVVGMNDSTKLELMNYVEKSCRQSKSCSPQKIEMWKSSLLVLSDEKFRPYAWYQDFIQGQNNSIGFPQIRPITGYGEVRPEVDESFVKSLTEVMRENGRCIDENPHKIISPSRNVKKMNPYLGGNIEMLPGEVCLTSTAQEWEYSGKYWCKDEKKMAKIDLDWMTVGHVDEVITTIPNSNLKSPCNFSIVWASPQKAIDLLKKKENAKSPFFNFFNDPTYNAQKQNGSLPKICQEIRKQRLAKKNRKSPLPNENNKSSSSSKLSQFFMDHLLKSAQATGFDIVDDEKDEKKKSPTKKNKPLSAQTLKVLKKMEIDPQLFIKEFGSDADPLSVFTGCDGLDSPTNEEVAQWVEEDDSNLLIETKMRNNLNIIVSKLKESTGCSEIDTIAVPQLFDVHGGPLKQNPEKEFLINGKMKKFGEMSLAEKKLLKPEERSPGLPNLQGVGLNPNITNAVFVGKTMISPKSWNSAISKEVERLYRNVGINYSEVDTFDAHRNQGNLHCRTQTIPACRN